MEENIKLDIQKSINQVRDMIELCEEDIKIKIPEKVKVFFIRQYDENVDYLKLQVEKPLKEQQMERYTPEIITYIVNKYVKG